MNKRLLYSLMSILAVFSMLLAACVPAATPTEAPAPVQTEAPAAPVATEAPAATEAPKAAFKACQVTDTGGIDDKSFNATAWKGVEDAVKAYNIEGKYLESQQQTDYEKNINAFIDEKCDIIITVGFLLGDGTKAAAEKNPDQKFSIVDYAYDPTIPNVLGQVFSTDQAGFLAGYVAAGVSKTGKVGTFGGIQIPTVTAFMDGYALGVKAYNEKRGTKVEVLGWDPFAQTGLFTGNFESTDDGRTMGETLMDEGADIIMPVAGPVGLGTAAAVKERGNAYIIGVDSDWYLTAPDYKDIVLTSVMKNMDITTMAAIKSVMDGTFAGGVTVGDLKNGGVGLAPFHDLEAAVPADLVTELDAIKADILAGTLATNPAAVPEAEKPKALGTADNPLIMALAPSATSQELIASGDEIAKQLSDATGLVIKTTVPTSYSALVEAMGSGNAHIGWLPPLAYLLAKQKGYADVALATIRNGSDHYATQFEANAAAGFTAYFDPATNKSTADAKTALAQFDGKKPCWTDPLSASGYVIPSGLVAGAGAKVKSAAMVQGHPTVIRALYAGGICDFGATHDGIMTDKGLLEAFPDLAQKVVIIWRSDPIIPNDNVSFASSLPADIRTKLTDAMVAMAGTEAGLAALNSVYQIQGLKVVDDTFYDEFRVYLEAAGFDTSSYK
jgi:phosphate/phosphite/phosphonate ABC transporter binding protein